MLGGGSMRAFLARYFPIFMFTVLLGCFSASALLSLAGTTYWRDLLPAQRTDYLGIALMVLMPLLVLGNLLIIRGRSWAVWVVAGYFLGCLAMTIPMIQYRPHQGVYLFAILLPLLGLLLLNSKRHREMREKLLEVRHERQRVKKAAR
ncbi:hypothetical protein [Pseudomonas sp. Fl4BN1]|uniref:hypothetical protein n=1 Tax=Pseudomonas sp. Fl4BN1 TaxID=2697651 RepID=UPI0013773FED|nr:hypothetical protein [Pseudomonas sp. Fl4BN1]NBF10527.1 hypothetical protein [Pseudomonas sp. Fl4BN1]